MIVLKSATNVMDIVDLQPVAILNTLFTTTNAENSHQVSFWKWFLNSSVDEFLATDLQQFVGHFNEHQLSLLPSSCHFDFSQSFMYITTCSDFPAAAISVSDLSLLLLHVRRSTSCHIDTRRHTSGSHTWGRGCGSPYRTGPDNHTDPGCCPTGSRSRRTPGSSWYWRKQQPPLFYHIIEYS